MTTRAPLGSLGSTLRIGLREVAARAGRKIATAPYLRKWVLLSSAIGIIAGFGAVVFYSALSGASWLFLHWLLHYNPPLPAGEGVRRASAGFARPWAVPLVVGFGGLVSGLLVFLFAPEAEGHGTDAAIRAVHENPRSIRVRTVIVKIVASALTIGSGGSGGREGPTAQISAGFGSLLSRLLNLSPADGRIAVSVGIGSGIGAIFKAPLGGAVLAAEILYRDDIEVETIIPAIIASILSYAVFGAFEGFKPLFGYVHSYVLQDPVSLVWFALIGVVSGLIGLLYSKGFYGIADLFGKLPVSRFFRPAIGATGVGLLALAVPEVLSTGYGWVQQGLDRNALMHMSLAVVLLLPFLRILATGLSIGSGGSGGIFGPGIVIGAFVGGGIWRLLEPIGRGVPHDPTAFVVVGMMACFGSISRAPLAIMLMVAEMTSSIEIVAPAMLAVGLGTLIVRRSDDTIYRSQLRTRAESRAHRLQFGMPFLSSVAVSEMMKAPLVVLDVDDTVEKGIAQLRSAEVPGAPVVDRHGIFVGTVNEPQLAGVEEGHPERTLEHYVDVTAPTVPSNSALDAALDALGNTHESWVSVLDSGRRVVGIVKPGDIVRGYRRALASSTRRLSSLAGDAEPTEVPVGQGAPVAGRAIRDASLPRGTIVVSITRDKGLIFAEADTILKPGDLVSALVLPGSVDHFRWLMGAGGTGSAGLSGP